MPTAPGTTSTSARRSWRSRRSRTRTLRLLLLYLEHVGDPESLVRLGELSRRNDVPVVALVGGRSQGGSRAAASHTGALATERRVLDAFFERVGIWQVHGVKELVAASELYLRDWQPTGERLAVVSNSGAVCVLAADAAEDARLPLAELAPATVTRLQEELPAFAATSNPVDVTAALLTDSSIFGRVLPILGSDPNVDACLLGIPVAGRGYDVEQFARDAADVRRLGYAARAVRAAAERGRAVPTGRAAGLRGGGQRRRGAVAVPRPPAPDGPRRHPAQTRRRGAIARRARTAQRGRQPGRARRARRARSSRTSWWRPPRTWPRRSTGWVWSRSW